MDFISMRSKLVLTYLASSCRRRAQGLAWLALVAALWPCAGVAAAAGPSKLSAEWVALGSDGAKRSVPLLEGKSQPFAEIMPRTVFRLDQDAMDARGNVLIPRGTVLTQVRELADTRCEVQRRKGNATFACLRDTDGDGRFDSVMKMVIDSELFIAGGSTNLKAESLAVPVMMTGIDPRKDTQHFIVELYFASRAHWVGHNDVQVCIVRRDLKNIWGAEMDVRMCLEREFDLKDGRDYPYSVSLYGGAFTFLSRQDNSIDVEIVPPPRDFVF